LKYDHIYVISNATPQDFDIVKNIYLVKRQEHVTNSTT